MTLIVTVVLWLATAYTPYALSNTEDSSSGINSNNTCGNWTSCTQCALRTGCNWCESLGACFDVANADTIACPINETIDEGPGCINEEFVTMVAFNHNEKLVYDLTIDNCESSWRNHTSPIDNTFDLQDFQNMEFLYDIMGSSTVMENNIEITCKREYVSVQFWTLQSEDANMNYHLLARLVSFDDDDSDTSNKIDESVTEYWPPCEVFVHYGSVTEITCVNGTKNYYNQSNYTTYVNNSAFYVEYNKFNQKFQTDMLLTTLRFLLPRTDKDLYVDNETQCDQDRESLISEDEPNGDVTPCRIFYNDTNTSYAQINKVTSACLYFLSSFFVCLCAFVFIRVLFFFFLVSSFCFRVFVLDALVLG